VVAREKSPFYIFGERITCGVSVSVESLPRNNQYSREMKCELSGVQVQSVCHAGQNRNIGIRLPMKDVGYIPRDAETRKRGDNMFWKYNPLDVLEKAGLLVFD
jgi:hypothetical protein